MSHSCLFVNLVSMTWLHLQSMIFLAIEGKLYHKEIFFPFGYLWQKTPLQLHIFLHYPIYHDMEKHPYKAHQNLAHAARSIEYLINQYLYWWFQKFLTFQSCCQWPVLHCYLCLLLHYPPQICLMSFWYDLNLGTW